MADPDNLQEHQAESVQPDMPVSEQEYFSHWKAVNTAVFFLSGIGVLGALMYAPGITMPLLTAVIILNLFLAYWYGRWVRTGKGRNSLRILRGIASVCSLAVFLPYVIFSNFNQNRFFYSVKKFYYTHGVYTNSEYLEKILPGTLPGQCEDYLFIVQPGLAAQDYHASSYLAFHTDEQTLRNYAQKMEQMGIAPEQSRQSDAPEFDHMLTEKEKALYLRPENLPAHVWQRLLPEHYDALEHAVLYIIHDYYDKGCLLNYDSGLAIFWT